MTEDEAKTKWCPFARSAPSRGAVIYNRDGAGNPYVLCIGSACMAWRPLHDMATETTRSSQRPAGEGWMPGSGYDDWTRTTRVDLGGFCGLAGRPA